MKKTELVFLFLVLTPSVYSQSISQKLIAPFGYSFSNVYANLYFNLCQLITSTLTKGNKTLTLGFLQPLININSSETPFNCNSII